MASPISSRVCYDTGISKAPNLARVEASYDPNGALKGGLRFMAITPGATGIYYVQMKNINQVKYGVSSLADGDFSFDMKRVLNINAEVSSSTGGLNSSLDTIAKFDSANNRYIIYVFNNTGLQSLSTGNKLNITITYTNNIKGGI